MKECLQSGLSRWESLGDSSSQSRKDSRWETWKLLHHAPGWSQCEGKSRSLILNWLTSWRRQPEHHFGARVVWCVRPILNAVALWFIFYRELLLFSSFSKKRLGSRSKVFLASSSAVVIVWILVGVKIKQHPAQVIWTAVRPTPVVLSTWCWNEIFGYLPIKAPVWLPLPATVRDLSVVICFHLRMWGQPLWCGREAAYADAGLPSCVYFPCSQCPSHFRR